MAFLWLWSNIDMMDGFEAQVDTSENILSRWPVIAKYTESYLHKAVKHSRRTVFFKATKMSYLMASFLKTSFKWPFQINFKSNYKL